MRAVDNRSQVELMRSYIATMRMYKLKNVVDERRVKERLCNKMIFEGVLHQLSITSHMHFFENPCTVRAYSRKA